jgi:hypothetical protein
VWYAGQWIRASLIHTSTYTKVAGLKLERRLIHLSTRHTRTRFCRCCTWTSCRIWRRLSASQASKSSRDDGASRRGCGGSRKARGSRCNPPQRRLHRRRPAARGSRRSRRRAWPGGRDLAAEGGARCGVGVAEQSAWVEARERAEVRARRQAG